VIAEPESRFTGPTAICPHPEWWTSTDDHSTEVEVSELIYGLVRGVQPDYCIETGSAWGQTARAIGEALAANGHGRLVSLDVDADRVAYSRVVCKDLPRVTIVQESAMDYTPDGTVGFAFFDSLFNLRVPEFLRYFPHMVAGTVVAFHDSAPGHGGGQFESGRDLLNEIEVELKDHLAVIHLPTPRGITIGVVR
jgi:predicted O-methyltransferase YrrM